MMMQWFVLKDVPVMQALYDLDVHFRMGFIRTEA